MDPALLSESELLLSLLEPEAEPDDELLSSSFPLAFGATERGKEAGQGEVRARADAGAQAAAARAAGQRWRRLAASSYLEVRRRHRTSRRPRRTSSVHAIVYVAR
jgi:hypothetical protein